MLTAWTRTWSNFLQEGIKDTSRYSSRPRRIDIHRNNVVGAFNVKTFVRFLCFPLIRAFCLDNSDRNCTFSKKSRTILSLKWALVEYFMNVDANYVIVVQRYADEQVYPDRLWRSFILYAIDSVQRVTTCYRYLLPATLYLFYDLWFKLSLWYLALLQMTLSFSLGRGFTSLRAMLLCHSMF